MSAPGGCGRGTPAALAVCDEGRASHWPGGASAPGTLTVDHPNTDAPMLVGPNGEKVAPQWALTRRLETLVGSNPAEAYEAVNWMAGWRAAALSHSHRSSCLVLRLSRPPKMRLRPRAASYAMP